MRGDVICQISTLEGANVVGRAKDCATEGGVLESRCMQMVKHHLLRHTFHLNMRSCDGHLQGAQTQARRQYNRAIAIPQKRWKDWMVGTVASIC